jgi:hypothetical protein
VQPDIVTTHTLPDIQKNLKISVKCLSFRSVYLGLEVNLINHIPLAMGFGGVGERGAERERQRERKG